MSLKSKILEYVKAQYPNVVHKGEIGRQAVLNWGYENENAGRRCRELEEAGLIEKVPHPKHEAQYRWVPDSTFHFPAAREEKNLPPEFREIEELIKNFPPAFIKTKEEVKTNSLF